MEFAKKFHGTQLDFQGGKVNAFHNRYPDSDDGFAITRFVDFDDFTIQLYLKEEEEEMYIIKGNQNKSSEDIVKLLENTTKLLKLPSPC